MYFTHEKATVEIPMGSRNKYELDQETGLLHLSREISLPYPSNYGFIPYTLSEDGDPLDIFLISHFPISPLVQVRYHVVGVIEMVDEGKEDNKIVAVLPGYTGQIEHTYNDIIHFLTHYKQGTAITNVSLDPHDARVAVEKAYQRWLKNE